MTKEEQYRQEQKVSKILAVFFGLYALVSEITFIYLFIYLFITSQNNGGEFILRVPTYRWPMIFIYVSSPLLSK